MRWAFLVCVAGLTACVAEPEMVRITPEIAEADTGTGAIAPSGFGEVTMVTLAPGVYRVATEDGASEPDLVVEGGQYAVRRVAADRVRNGFASLIALAPDGTQAVTEAPPVFTTRPTIRVGGTEGLNGTSSKRVAVLAAMAFCGLPVPTAEDLYLWGDEPVMRAGDTGEWQFTDMC